MGFVIVIGVVLILELAQISIQAHDLLFELRGLRRDLYLFAERKAEHE